MRTRVLIFAVMALLGAPVVFSGCAGPQPQIEAKVRAKTSGETVRLFHGGTKEAKEVFCLNETVPVFRQEYERYGQGGYKEVGKVKITKFRGEHYFDAEVIEGELKDGDVARKKDAACLIRLPGPEEK